MSANETPARDLIGVARGALGEECLQDAKCDLASKLEPAGARSSKPGEAFGLVRARSDADQLGYRRLRSHPYTHETTKRTA